MSDYLDVDVLTSQTLPEADVQLAKGKVRVRGLSRGEVFAMQKSRADGGIKDEAAWERRMVSIALLTPEVTEDQVGAWQRGPAGGDLEAVTNKISELSGLSEGADKSGLPALRDDSGSGVRVLPGDEADADGGPTAGADEQ
jgi:hypothetical protein